MDNGALIIMRVVTATKPFRNYAVLRRENGGQIDITGRALLEILKNKQVTEPETLFAEIIARLSVGGSIIDPEEYNYEAYNYTISVDLRNIEPIIKLNIIDNKKQLVYTGSIDEAVNYFQFDDPLKVKLYPQSSGEINVVGSRYPGPIVACRHGNPRDKCRNCQMLTFLLVRSRAVTDHDYPMNKMLIDLCKIIFKVLPNQNPSRGLPKNCVKTLKDCGPHARMPSTVFLKEDFICGVQLRKRDSVPQTLFCINPATLIGKSGLWCCPNHKMRPNPNMPVIYNPYGVN